MKPKNRVYCPESNKCKILFESESKAKRFIDYNGGELEVPEGATLRPYYCPSCGGYHITHKRFKAVYEYQAVNIINRYKKITTLDSEKRSDPVSYIIKKVPKKLYHDPKEKLMEYVNKVWPEIGLCYRVGAVNKIKDTILPGLIERISSAKWKTFMEKKKLEERDLTSARHKVNSFLVGVQKRDYLHVDIKNAIIRLARDYLKTRKEKEKGTQE